jgi:hypothetical protein
MVVSLQSSLPQGPGNAGLDFSSRTAHPVFRNWLDQFGAEVFVLHFLTCRKQEDGFANYFRWRKKAQSFQLIADRS